MMGRCTNEQMDDGSMGVAMDGWMDDGSRAGGCNENTRLCNPQSWFSPQDISQILSNVAYHQFLIQLTFKIKTKPLRNRLNADHEIVNVNTQTKKKRKIKGRMWNKGLTTRIYRSDHVHTHHPFYPPGKNFRNLKERPCRAALLMSPTVLDTFIIPITESDANFLGTSGAEKTADRSATTALPEESW
jgi:hypothetical protein